MHGGAADWMDKGCFCHLYWDEKVQEALPKSHFLLVCCCELSQGKSCCRNLFDDDEKLKELKKSNERCGYFHWIQLRLVIFW
jgi:hypothetical protein